MRNIICDWYEQTQAEQMFVTFYGQSSEVTMHPQITNRSVLDWLDLTPEPDTP